MIPVQAIERLIRDAKGSTSQEVQHCAGMVEQWLIEAKTDPRVVLADVMSALGALPSCSEDFLGPDLYARVETALGWPEDEDEEGDEEESARIVKNFEDADRFVDKLLTGTADEFRVPVADARQMGGLLKDLLAEVRK